MASFRDPAPLAIPPLWGFGGDGARRRRSGAKKPRQFATKQAHQNDKNKRNLNYLGAGWGARIRTSEWRNQNLDVLLYDSKKRSNRQHRRSCRRTQGSAP